NGNRVQVIDGRGNRTTTYYNADNEVALSVDATGFARANTYDGNGNVIRRIDYMTVLSLPVSLGAVPVPLTAAADRTTTYAYDQLNRLVTQTDALGGVSHATYDGVGNTLSRADENGHVTTYAYDANNRLLSVKDPSNRTATYSYDAVGNV